VISLGRRQLRVVDKRDADADQPPVLIVGGATPNIDAGKWSDPGARRA
jgi:hypothetical protein